MDSGMTLLPSRASQTGMTFIGWVFVLSLLGLGFLIALRLVPAYLEAYKVNAAVASLESQDDLRNGPPGEIRQALMRRLSIDDVDSVEREHVSLDDVSGGTQLVVDYERRVDLLGNLDAVASFRYEALVRN